MAKIFLTFLILLALLVVDGCAEKTPSPLPIKISLVTAFPGHAYAFIAQEKKLFAKYGVNVELIPHPDQMSASAAYESSQVEGLMVPFTDAIKFALKGISSRVVYGIDYSETAGSVGLN